nr:GNAT family N-acetyltransferase [uncultured Cohaesibacter sp.]
MQPEIAIHPANRSDFAAIAQLQADSWASSYRCFLPPAYMRERMHADIADCWQRHKIDKRDLVLQARLVATGELVGFISLLCRPLPFIDKLHCAPSFTGLGIGARLLSCAFSALVKRGENTASLTVVVGNEGARRFYLRHGAHLAGKQRELLNGYPVEVEVMEWSALNATKWHFE